MNDNAWESEMAQIVLSSYDQQQINITVGEVDLEVLVAASDETRKKGLSNYDTIPCDGMLFMYAFDNTDPFHRTLMRFDIAIRFYDDTGRLLHEDLANHAAHCPVPYRYVLETDIDKMISGALTVHG